MAPKTQRSRLALALAIGLAALIPAASAAEHPPGIGAYHQAYRTAARPDPRQAARDPSDSACCDGQAAPWWNEGNGSRPESAWWAQHRPDPNRRRVEGPSERSDGTWWRDGAGWDGWHGYDERSRRGWRAGWRGAAPGWGGVWWSGWGGDWPAYAGGWERGGWHHRDRGGRVSWGEGHRGRWHGEFGFEHGWGDGRRVIALPAPDGE